MDESFPKTSNKKKWKKREPSSISLNSHVNKTNDATVAVAAALNNLGDAAIQQVQLMNLQKYSCSVRTWNKS